MNELYELIEKKIKASGYPRPISGADVYDDICDQIEGKDNGTYLLLSKFEEDVKRVYENQDGWRENAKKILKRYLNQYIDNIGFKSLNLIQNIENKKGVE